ncbi:MAG: FkbM family methyltransferase [Gammaproteobacteria bacterium]
MNRSVDTTTALQPMDDIVQTLPCRYGSMSFFPFDGPIGDALQAYGEWAQAEIEFLAQFVPPGGVVIDAGANVGTHTLALSSIAGDSGRVYAVEAQPQVFEVLTRNLVQNAIRNVRAFDAAVSCVAGTVSIPAIDPTQRQNVGALSLAAGQNPAQPDMEMLTVPVITLDSVCEENVDLIKIDVEAMELDVLRGAQQNLARSRSVVYLECNDLERGWDIVKFFREYDYAAYFCRFPAFNIENFRGNPDNMFGVAEESSLLFVPRERVVNLQAAIAQCSPVERLDELAVALLATPRYGDSTNYDRDPEQLRRRLDAIESKSRSANQSVLESSNQGPERDRAAVRIRSAIDRALTLVRRMPPAEALAESETAYDILIPIYNAYDHVKRCVESVLRYTDPKHCVILLDDASSDPRVLPLLRGFESSDPRVRVVTSDSNLGFIGNVNRGFMLSRHDVVILNSDTEVTAGWLARLDRCRLSDPAIGIVSPLSNNATILSVPVMSAANRLPPDMSVDRFAAIVAENAPRSYPRLPTAVGFCMLITRATLDRVGVFDSVFGLGYGEESDFCMRAWHVGIETVCCDDAYVHHYGEASFSSIKQIGKRRLRNAQVLAKRWPKYDVAVQVFCHHNPLREVQERLQTALERKPGEVRPHVLHVIHSFDVPGGTELHTRRLIDGLEKRYRSTVMFPGRNTKAERSDYVEFHSEQRDSHLRVVELRERNVVARERFVGIAGDLDNAIVEGNFTRFVAGGDYDIVHFQHLAHWDSLLLPVLAKALGKKVVVSLHDYFLLCPEYNLMLPEYRRCGREQSNGADPQCMRCLSAKRELSGIHAPAALNQYMGERQALVQSVLEAADILIAPSAFVRDQFCRALGETVGAKIRVVPHGVVVKGRSARPPRTSTFRVGFLGNLTERKGAYTVLDAVERMRGEAVQVEVFGGVQDTIKARAVSLGLRLHGNYSAEELPKLLGRVDVVIIPSVWDETFCLTVSEAQAMGVPVVAAAVGAIPERVVDGVTGFLVPPSDPAALAKRLLELAQDRSSLTGVHAGLEGLVHKSMEDNVGDYDAVYSELLHGRDGSRQLVTGLLDVADNKLSPEKVRDRLVEAYERWRAARAPTAEQLDQLRQAVEGKASQPGMHLVMVVSEKDMSGLPDTLESVSAQHYGRWKLSVVADCPAPDPLFSQHPALRWVEVDGGGWLEAVNRVIGDVEADWVGLVGPGDRFDVSLLLQCADYIQRHEKWRFVYTDEDRIGADGREYEPRLKPDVNLEWLRGQAYVGRFCLVAREVLLALGGYVCLDGMEAYDAVLRIIERCGDGAVGHIPHILYHRLDANRTSSEKATVLGMAIVTEHLSRCGTKAAVQPGIARETWRVEYEPMRLPQVAVVVHGRGSADEVTNSVQSVLETTTYPDMRVWLSLAHRDHSVAQGLRVLADRDARIGLLETPQDIGAVEAEYLLFVCDGMRVVQPNWVERMVAQALPSEAGIVGARVVGADQSIRGIGKILGLGTDGIAAPLQPGLTHSAPGYFGRAQVAQEMSAVSRDGLLIEKALYADLGIDMLAPNRHHGDTEICLRAQERGRRVIWTPHVTIFAGQPDTTGQGAEKEVMGLRARWLPRLANDPAFHPALSLHRPDVALEDDLPAWSARDNHDLPRILGMAFGSAGSWEYRGSQPLHVLGRRGIANTAEVPTYPDQVRVPGPVELARLDVDSLLLYNTVHDAHIEALRQYRRGGGAFVTFGQDDLMTALPAKNPLRSTIYKDIKKRLRECLSLCDRLIVTTEALGHHFRSYIGDIRIVPNRLDHRWADLEVRRRVGDRPRIGWVGALQHGGDLQLLDQVVRETAREVDWVFMGMCPEPIRPYVAEFHGPVPYDDYPTALAALGLDIAVAPLEYNSFNEAKSNLRLLEYGVLGCPVICTDIEPYRNAPVTRVANTASAWINAIRDRVHDLDAAEQEGVQLREWVRSQWMLDDHLDEWMEALLPASDR